MGVLNLNNLAPARKNKIARLADETYISPNQKKQLYIIITVKKENNNKLQNKLEK